MIHSFKRSKKLWEKSKRKEVMSQPSSPTDHDMSIFKLWRKYKPWCISVCVWVIQAGRLHGYLQPFLFAHPAAISMSQESINSQKNIKNMFIFSFYKPPVPCQWGAQPLCVANPINKTVKHLSCNWIPAHDKERIWSTTNSWEEHSILTLCFTAHLQFLTKTNQNFGLAPKRRRGERKR